ncbi:hypothetical protein K503DRAFT_774619 [Rhizopogon vinicolor AM-OR11-026]|uniref:Uncharacterized protein n=1 Tax=Rhizopogon vinicolor AM-OR11-026 TaxID=1314800 RepID=A0A1B7MP48_9AGAM|nr:hypothetical protein K503DRAFT_774619 [Rhizopogon vinicolor AM-OR11-026]
MTRPNRRDLESRSTEPGILSNVFSFVSREIGEFVVSATGGAGESGPSKRKRRLQHERRREGEERGRQRRGYDGSMIEHWREVNGSVEGGGKKPIDRKKLSADRRGHGRREKEEDSMDGKKHASSGSPPRSQSGQRHSQPQSREPLHSHVKKTKASSSSDEKLRAKSVGGYGRKTDRVYEYEDRPEDADGELTPSRSSHSPSPRPNSRSRGGMVRPHPQEHTARSPSPQDTSSSRANPPPPLNTHSTSSLPASHRISTATEGGYPTLRKKPSITMPGSLFPRSDSLEPDPEDVRVTSGMRFLSGSGDARNHERDLNPILHSSPESGGESEPGPSRYLDETPADKTGPSPWRTRPIASVHDALQRFNASGGEERDFSLLVTASPAGLVRPESPGTTQEKSHSLSGVSRKGKERAVVVDDEDGDGDLAFILDHHRVQDKEKQLDAARRETGAKSPTTNDGERERDKERIRILEEEVKMLKEEISRSRRSPPPPRIQTQVPIPPPPPPPPLPPPPAVRIPLPQHLRESRALFASARAALRQTEASSTASSNDTRKAAGGKMRQPTVNVPSDKMAAFLNEMRTVRLRKVGSGPGGLSRSVSDRSMDSDCPGPSGLSRSVSAAGVDGRREVEMARRKSMGAKVPIASASTSKAGASKPPSGSAPSNLAPASLGSSKPASTSSRSAFTSKLPTALSGPKPISTSTASKSSLTTTSAIAPTSSNATDARIGYKRKADVLGETDGGSASKRRSGTRAQVQSDTSTSLSSSSTHSNVFLAGPSLANHSSLSNETDITTPSLCSDNEIGDADVRMPLTPPGPRHSAAHTTHDEVIEIIDVDMDIEELEPPHRHITPSRPQGDMFRKRLPMSPLPVPTPRKPAAPARAKGRKYIPTPERTKRGATPKPKGIMLLDEDDDDDEEDDDELALPPRLQWKREDKPTAERDADVDRTTNIKGKRRLTLDEELARARSSDRLAELDVESGELTGTGTGSIRRGFLAGGGAGGAPVFMGVGYVRGAEEDAGRQLGSRIPRLRG